MSPKIQTHLNTLSHSGITYLTDSMSMSISTFHFYSQLFKLCPLKPTFITKHSDGIYLFMVPELTETWDLQVDIPEICDLGSEAFSFPFNNKSLCVCVCVCMEGTEGKIRGKERNWDSGLWWKDSNQSSYILPFGKRDSRGTWRPVIFCWVLSCLMKFKYYIKRKRGCKWYSWKRS